MPSPLIIQVVGRSGSGKTLTLVSAIGRLRRRGLRVAVLKHSHHPMDLPGKDTSRLRRGGADLVLFSSDRTVVIGDWDPIRLLPLLPVDVVLVEGYHGRRLSPLRFVVRNPEDARRVARAIVSSVPGPRAPVKLLVNGRKAPIDDVWTMIGALMAQRNVRRIELGK
jgi:molybdopterin-guanine dinucleotide biosynthesis adapter protein